MTESEFDEVRKLRESINHGISLSGENSDCCETESAYGKTHSRSCKSETIMDWVRNRRKRGVFANAFTPKKLIAVDVSEKSWASWKKRPRRVIAKVSRHSSLAKLRFMFCNGVFHHILPEDRQMLRLFTTHYNQRLFFLWKILGTRLFRSWVNSLIVTPKDIPSQAVKLLQKLAGKNSFIIYLCSQNSFAFCQWKKFFEDFH